MDNSSSIQANSALPDPEKERFEQEEQRKYEEWKTQQKGGEPCLLYTSPSPRDVEESRMPSSA